MAFPFWPFLYLLLTPLTWAGPLSTASLTPYLASIVPACAQSCLESFIAENFPTSVCGPPPNFPCLCTSDSTSGFTIGEASLECLVVGCNVFEESEAVAGYEVCTGVQSAKPNTHSTLTAVQTLVVSYTIGANQPAQTNSNNQLSTFSSNSYTRSFISAAASSTASGFTSKIASATRSSSSHSTSQHSQTTPPPAGGVLSNTTPTTPSTSSTINATAAAASSSATPPVLTKPQIAGVAVAGVGAAAIACGLCFLVFCCRRRSRTNRHSIDSSSSFGGDKVVGSEDSSPDMAAIARTDFAYRPRSRSEQAPEPVLVRSPPPRRNLRLETPTTSSEDGWDQYQRGMNTEYMGPQVPSKSVGGPSPITPASNRTHSQLLPDKPSGNRYSLFPPPSRTPRNSILGSSLGPPSNTGSRTALRSPGSVNTSQSNLQREYNLRKPSSDPFLDSSGSSLPNIYPYIQASRPRSPRRPQQNHLHPAFRVPSWDQPTGVVRKPLPAHQSMSARGVWPSSEEPRHPYLQRPYHPPSAGGHRYMAPTNDAHQRNKPSRNISNASTRFSNGSDTSIEDEPAPAPLKLRSPFQGGRVRYPSVPVSAAESPTSRPNVAELPSRSDSLANRRLGKQKAREITDRLQDQRQPSEESPRKSAKYQILVSPGRYGIENSNSPSSVRHVKRTPPMDPHW